MSGPPFDKAILATVVCGLAVAPLLVAPFTVTLLNYVGIGALVALGLVLLTGFGGLTSFGQASLVGIGAYATAWLSTQVGADPWLGLVLALALTGGIGARLGGASPLRGALRVVVWGVAAMLLTMLVGHFVGPAV